jgi:phosphoribosylformylglycinamidine cyclo-ligase
MPSINQASGVDYDVLDAFKRTAQELARTTSIRYGVVEAQELGESRGESAFLIDNGDHYIANVEEGLGTKNLVADAIRKLPFINEGQLYRRIGWDAAATILNDVSAVGALPIGLAMHLAVGDSRWFKNLKRAQGLLLGWKDACIHVGCVWGPGETSELRGLVNPRNMVISGSAIGKTVGKQWFNPNQISAGDAIVFLESNGIHANGLTKARAIAAKLPKGYETKVPGGGSFWRELVNVTHVYGSTVEYCLRRNITVHYAVNVTGHGWRKLMRANGTFTYLIETLPTGRPIFDFIQKHSGKVGNKLTDQDMYASYNMGVGFALIMPQADARRLVKQQHWPYRVFIAGHVKQGEKRVVIKPKGIELKGDTLQVR